jgi:hypothetical protein
VINDSRRGTKTLSLLEVRLTPMVEDLPLVGVVLVGWDPRAVAGVICDADAWATSLRARCVKVVVLNRQMVVSVPKDWLIVQGTNSAGEFSGYDEGARALRSSQPGVWIFMNDRVADYGGSPLHLVGRGTLCFAAGAEILVGHRVALGRQLFEGSPALAHYVQTHYFIVGSRTLDRIGALTSHEISSQNFMFPDEWPLAASSPPAGPALLASTYLQFLGEWLTGEGGALQSHWYRASSAVADLPGLRRKAVAILNEHSLSARSKDLGIAIVDTRWAARAGGLQRRPTVVTRAAGWWDAANVSLDSRSSRVFLLTFTATVVLADTVLVVASRARLSLCGRRFRRTG